MKSKACAGLVVSILFAFTSLATAQAMFDNFDSYTLGSIEGQGGWQSWVGYSGICGDVTIEQAFSGAQSLKVEAGDDTVHPFTGVNSGQWTLSLRQYIPSTSGGQNYTILLNSYPNNLNWSAQVLADIDRSLVGVFDSSSVQQGSSVALVRDTWVDMRFEIDLDANSVSAFYNQALMASFAWQTGGINELQALDLYPDEGVPQVGPVYYDNVRLEQVPEPGVGSLLFVVAAAFFFRRRRRG